MSEAHQHIGQGVHAACDDPVSCMCACDGCQTADIAALRRDADCFRALDAEPFATLRAMHDSGNFEDLAAIADAVAAAHARGEQL